MKIMFGRDAAPVSASAKTRVAEIDINKEKIDLIPAETITTLV